LTHLFDLSSNHSIVAIDETKQKVEESEVYIKAAVDVEMFEIIDMDVSIDRSDLDAPLFTKQVSKR